MKQELKNKLKNLFVEEFRGTSEEDEFEYHFEIFQSELEELTEQEAIF